MPKVLVCQHVAYEPLGLLDPLLRQHRFRIRYVNFGRRPDSRPDLDGYDGLILLGGPMNVDDAPRLPHLAHEMELVRTAVARERPVLGICLGAQLMAKALGGEVAPAPEKEIGWYDLELADAARRCPLFHHFHRKEKVFQWHGQAFTPPPGATHLASTPGCPHQAFSFGERAYGLQFHLEADRALIRRWLTLPAHRQELAELHDAGRPQTIAEDTERYIERSLALGRETFRRFVGLFAPRRRVIVLPTR